VTDYADAAAVSQYAKGLSNEFLLCRTYRHPWQPETATWNKAYRYYHVTHICPRCGSRKHEEMSERGQVYSGWIEYAEGYLLEGVGRIAGDGRDVLRLTSIERTFQVTRMSAAESRADVPHSAVTREALGLNEGLRPQLRVVANNTRERAAG